MLQFWSLRLLGETDVQRFMYAVIADYLSGYTDISRTLFMGLIGLD